MVRRNLKAYVYLTLETTRDGAHFAAVCRQTSTPSYGDSVEEAESNLKKALVAEFKILGEAQNLGRYISDKGLQVSSGKLKAKSQPADISENRFVSCFRIEVPASELSSPQEAAVTPGRRNPSPLANR